MAKNENTKNTGATVNIGRVQGPVHTGNGDMHIDQLNYGSINENNTALQERILQSVDGIAENFTEAIKVIIDQLENQQLAEINQAYDLLEKHQLLKKNITPILSELQTIVEILDDKVIPPDLVKNIQTTANIIDVEEMNVNQKLKLSIPLIPLILNYENEIGLDSTINLKRAWSWIKGKF